MVYLDDALTDSERLANVLQNGLSPQGQPSAVGAPRLDPAGERAGQGRSVVVGGHSCACGDEGAIYIRFREEKLGAYLCVNCEKAEIRRRVGFNE